MHGGRMNEMQMQVVRCEVPLLGRHGFAIH